MLFYFNYHLDRQGSPWSFVASLAYCFAGTSGSGELFLIAQQRLKSYHRVYYYTSSRPSSFRSRKIFPNLYVNESFSNWPGEYQGGINLQSFVQFLGYTFLKPKPIWVYRPLSIIVWTEHPVVSCMIMMGSLTGLYLLLQAVWHLLVHSFIWKCWCWCAFCCFTVLIRLKNLNKSIAKTFTCLLLLMTFWDFNGSCYMERHLLREWLFTLQLANYLLHVLGILLALERVW